MALKLISGPPGSGKTRLLMEILARALDRRPAFYILPSDIVAQDARRHFLAARDRTIVGAVFLSWGEFIALAADIQEPLIRMPHAILLINALLASHPLRYFHPDAVSIGIAREFARTIATLKHNLIDTRVLRRELETRGSLKENDLLTVFERYEEHKTHLHMSDEGDLACIASRAIVSQHLPQYAGIGTIIFDEFHEITPGQAAIIRSIATSMRDIECVVAMPRAARDDAPYAPHWQRMIDSFADIAADHTALKAGEIQSPAPMAFALRSPSAEQRAAITQIIELAHNGAPLSDVSIALRMGDGYLEGITAEAARYGFSQSELPLMGACDAPVIRRLMADDSVKELPDHASPGDYAKAMAERLKALAHIDRWRDDLAGDATRAMAARSIVATAHAEEFLRSLAAHADLLGSFPIKRSDLLEMAHEFLSLPPSCSSLDMPFAIRPFEAPPIAELHTAFIPHLVEGHIPQANTQRIFFGDMDDFGGGKRGVLDDVFPSADAALAMEAALFDVWRSKSQHPLVCSYPVVGYDGKECVPSSFLDGIEHHPRECPPDIPAPLRKRSFTSDMNGVIDREHRRTRVLELDPAYRGVITDDGLKDMLRRRFIEHRFSATSLETYARCPFMFFAQYVLNLKPEEDVTPEIMPKDRGTIIHAVLDKFYRLHLDAFRAAVTMPKRIAAVDAIIDDLVDGTFAEHASLIGYASASLDEYQRRAVTTLVRQVVRLELDDARALPDPLLPAHCEWAFGFDDAAPLAIDVPGDTASGTLIGCIDRIDVSSDKTRFIVSDYKTGRTVSSVKQSILKGLHLQLPLYVEAARVFLYPNAEALGGILIAVQEGHKRHGFLKKSSNDINYRLGKRLATLMDDDEWNEALAVARQAAGAYIARIRAGEFPLEPQECAEFCDFRDICRRHGNED